MKKSKIFRPLQLLVLLAGCFGYATAAPYGPNGRETRWTQPNGEVIPLKVFGDEYYARVESPAGYTLVFSDNTYYYAQLSADGKSLESTGVPAEQAAPGGLGQHLDLPKEEIAAKAKVNHVKYDTERNNRWNRRVDAVRKIKNAANGVALKGPEAADAKINAAPVLGDKLGLTILVQFPNDPATSGSDAVDFPVSRTKAVRYLNEVGYNDDGNTGSVRDFFYDQSNGLTTYTQKATTIVTLPHPRNYYNYSDYPANKTLYVDIDVAASDIIDDAVTVLKSEGFDFSGLTVDTDGQAIATNVLFAGPDSGVFARGLWPHQFHVNRTITVGVGDSITLYNYQITNIEDTKPVIGTFCHENGHLLCDYPDLYSFDGEGVGEHCLMGSGNYLNDGKTPSPINGYLKDIVGWGNVTAITPDQFLTVKLPSTGNIGYRIDNPNASTEFFFVENRGNGDKWAQYSNDKGIAIWHVDETIDGNLRGGAHYGIALEQADGDEDLENGRNRGDSGDLFDRATPKFTDGTTPDARWWDGSKSFIDVQVLSNIGAKTTVAFGGIPPNTIIVQSPNGGEVFFKDSNYPISWDSNIVGNVRIDLYKGGQFERNISLTEVNDGFFAWPVPKKLTPATNYTIRISSLTNPVPTFDDSDAFFTVTDATFPPTNALPFGWYKPGFASTGWDVTSSTSFEGTRSLKSKPTTDGKTAAIAYRSIFNAGTVSFYLKISSEKGFDVSRFYIDGKAQAFLKGGPTGISGDKTWQFYQFAVPSGKHELMWTYEKDSSYAGLKDTAWLDGVTLPPGTQEIVVQQPEGNTLVDGESTRTFSDVPINETSKPLVFTIKNKGKAYLLDIGVTKVGNDASDFKVDKLGKTMLAPGESTTFEVTFTPSNYGLRTTQIRIASNDGDEGRFAIDLKGTGVGLPKIGVNQPSANPLKDGDSRNFGIAAVDSEGNVKKFTIINNGASVLNELKVGKSGPNKEDFAIGTLGVKSLEPGESTTFTVTFTPSDLDVRTATLHVESNDTRSGPFDIVVSGKGSPSNLKRTSPAASASLVDAVLGSPASSGVSAASTAVEVVNGHKYLALTVAKNSGGVSPGTVEVSSNLLDWYSGQKHTTILIDDEATLKVRDNTPITQDAKRYIRLK